MKLSRDLRDPRKLGAVLLSLRDRPGNKRKKLSRLYDENHAELLLVEPYTGVGEGIQAEQQAKYEAEFPDGIPVVSDDPGGA